MHYGGIYAHTLLCRHGIVGDISYVDHPGDSFIFIKISEFFFLRYEFFFLRFEQLFAILLSLPKPVIHI